MKKPVKIALAVVGGIIVIGAIASASGSKSNKQSVPNSNSSNSASAQSNAQAAAQTMTIKNSAYKDENGEITNNDTGKHSATVKATFYATDGSIKGTASGAVNDVAPGETKTFTLLTTDDVTGYKDMKVQVDTLL